MFWKVILAISLRESLFTENFGDIFHPVRKFELFVEI